MRKTQMWIGTSLLVASLVLLTSACQKSGTEESLAVSEASLPREQAEPLKVREIIVGPQMTSALPPPMGPNDPIEVLLRTTGTASAADLSVTLISLADGSVAASQSIQINANAPREQTIRFERDLPWNTGRHLIEVMLDGALAAHQELDIYSEEAVLPQD